MRRSIDGLPGVLAALLAVLVASTVGADDKGFDFEIGGRVMNDWTFASADAGVEDAAGDFEDRVDFRRVRAFWRGKFYDRVEFKVQLDFAEGDAEFRDLYIALDKLPKVGKLQIGHFLEPFTLEVATSSRFLTFIERSLPVAFSPGRNTGVMVRNNLRDQRLHWALGVFRLTNDIGSNTDDTGEVTGDDFNVTGRVSGTPWNRDGGRRLLHLGAGFVLQDRDDTGVRFRARPEAGFAPRVVDTGRLAADGADLFGLEAAFVHDSFSAQAEHVTAEIDLPGSPTVSGSYVYASYFLTGENRVYSGKTGGFNRVRPKSDFLSGNGRSLGAWEVALRYSTLDLDDGVATGGEVEDVTLGVNWYWNPRTRVMLNFVQSDREDLGDAEIVILRLQVDF